jgi:nucleoside-diphosphate-sugar epimerase
MKILLITGTSGFIGKNLLSLISDEFLNSYKIVLLSSSSNNTNFLTIEHKNYTFSKEDFRKNNIEKIDIVLHLGAFIPKTGSEANDIEQSNSNILNTKYLLDHLPNLPEKFIFASTIDVYGRVHSIIDENILPQPLTMYGWSKLYCEKMLESWASQNKVILQVLRIGHIYGVGEDAYKKVIPVTIQKLKKSEKPQIFGKGEEKRSFLHVSDACSLILNSLVLDTYEKPINLCSSISYSIKEIIELLMAISKKQLEIEYITVENDPIDLFFDTSKMNRLLGTENMQLNKGLADEFHSYK